MNVGELIEFLQAWPDHTIEVCRGDIDYEYLPITEAPEVIRVHGSGRVCRMPNDCAEVHETILLIGG